MVDLGWDRGLSGVQVVGRLGVVAANDVKERLGDLLAEQTSALDEWFSAVNRRDAAVDRRKETAPGRARRCERLGDLTSSHFGRLVRIERSGRMGRAVSEPACRHVRQVRAARHALVRSRRPVGPGASQ